MLLIHMKKLQPKFQITALLIVRNCMLHLYFTPSGGGATWTHRQWCVGGREVFRVLSSDTLTWATQLGDQTPASKICHTSPLWKNPLRQCATWCFIQMCRRNAGSSFSSSKSVEVRGRKTWINRLQWFQVFFFNFFFIHWFIDLFSN